MRKFQATMYEICHKGEPTSNLQLSSKPTNDIKGIVSCQGAFLEALHSQYQVSFHKIYVIIVCYRGTHMKVGRKNANMGSFLGHTMDSNQVAF